MAYLPISVIHQHVGNTYQNDAFNPLVSVRSYCALVFLCLVRIVRLYCLSKGVYDIIVSNTASTGNNLGHFWCIEL